MPREGKMKSEFLLTIYFEFKLIGGGCSTVFPRPVVKSTILKFDPRSEEEVSTAVLDSVKRITDEFIEQQQNRPMSAMGIRGALAAMGTQKWQVVITSQSHSITKL
jgi:hypothetical protein